MTERDYIDYFGVSPTLLKAITNQKNNIIQDRFDFSVFNELLESSEKLKQVVNTPPGYEGPLLPDGLCHDGEQSALWQALIKDIWAGFYKSSPELNDESKMDLLYRTNRPFVEKFLEDPQTEQLRIHTMLDELTAGIATIDAAAKLKEEILNRPELQELLKSCYELEKQQDHGEKNQESNSQKIQKEIEKILKMQQGKATEIRQAMRAAVKVGKEEVEEAQHVLNCWGLEHGDLKTVPLGERLKLIEKLCKNNKLKQIAELVGRFRNLARAKQKNKVINRQDEIHSIIVGADISHVLPQELVVLKHPVLRLDFYRKLFEHSLLQYDLKTKEPQGKGPIVTLVDVSDSMSGKRIEWAIAVALGLVDTASRQKRRAKIIFFNTEVLKEVEFEPGERNIHKIFDIAQTDVSGGTKYVPALSVAKSTIENIKYKNAGIVMITDGYCEVPDNFINEFNESKKSLEYQCYTVIIDDNDNDKTIDNLKKWSDTVWAIKEMNDENAELIFECI